MAWVVAKFITRNAIPRQRPARKHFVCLFARARFLETRGLTLVHMQSDVAHSATSSAVPVAHASFTKGLQMGHNALPKTSKAPFRIMPATRPGVSATSFAVTPSGYCIQSSSGSLPLLRSTGLWSYVSRMPGYTQARHMYATMLGCSRAGCMLGFTSFLCASGYLDQCIVCNTQGGTSAPRKHEALDQAPLQLSPGSCGGSGRESSGDMHNPTT